MKFIAGQTYLGPRPGMVFKLGASGQGYYEDLGPEAHVQAFFAEKEDTVKYNKYPSDGTYYSKITAMMAEKAREEAVERAKEQEKANGQQAAAANGSAPTDAAANGSPAKEKANGQANGTAMEVEGA
ncbi:unnamed protein product [Amoebophrya sp. A25]|nr:unnamed protein product [Amoebophrya sp. A25]|eukprot:GSA25T00025897001.1